MKGIEQAIQILITKAFNWGTNYIQFKILTHGWKVFFKHCNFTSIWKLLWFLHIGFKVIVCDYSHTYNHLGLAIMDFVVSVTFLLLPPNCCYMSSWYAPVTLSLILHPKTVLHILHHSQMMCYTPWLRKPHTSSPLTLLLSNQTQKNFSFLCYEWPPLL